MIQAGEKEVKMMTSMEKIMVKIIDNNDQRRIEARDTIIKLLQRPPAKSEDLLANQCMEKKR